MIIHGNLCSQAQRLFYSLRLIKLKQVIELTLFYVSWIIHERIINVKGMKIIRNCPAKTGQFPLTFAPEINKQFNFGGQKYEKFHY